MNLAQGGIYWVAFPPSDGREQMGRRPALIVQGEKFLQSLPTVWVVPITSNLRAAHFPGTIRTEANEQNGLTASSVLLVFQLRAIDKRRLVQLVGKVSPLQLDQLLSMIDRLLGKQPLEYRYLIPYRSPLTISRAMLRLYSKDPFEDIHHSILASQLAVITTWRSLFKPELINMLVVELETLAILDLLHYT